MITNNKIPIPTTIYNFNMISSGPIIVVTVTVGCCQQKSDVY